MDINQWLQRTVTVRDEDVLEDEQDPDQTHRDHHATRDTRRAKLPAPVTSAHTRQRKASTNERKHKRHASTSMHSSSSSSASFNTESASQSSSASAPSERFERRKRHKTRENLYEPHSGQWKKRSRKKDKGADDGEKKKKKKKEEHYRTEKKRREAKKSGQNLINTFSADNVRQDRLTVRTLY